MPVFNVTDVKVLAQGVALAPGQGAGVDDDVRILYAPPNGGGGAIITWAAVEPRSGVLGSILPSANSTTQGRGMLSVLRTGSEHALAPPFAVGTVVSTNGNDEARQGMIAWYQWFVDNDADRGAVSMLAVPFDRAVYLPTTSFLGYRYNGDTPNQIDNAYYQIHGVELP